ncbi:PP2C family protein-serine/threonine phosphatase [Comamonas nitrativorans]|uniref:PP2C family protein-serine/threonine phosphatase n=1 Tax=Comamonas nitrativorans TaxID=108437 RepID=A0ABV9H1B1_9BURK
MKFSVFQLSRRGGRATNEDRMGYCYTREAALFVLADGMGGHAEGEIAAQLALQAMAAEFQRQATPRLADVPGFLRQGLMLAHERIRAYGRHKRMSDAPRTTLVAAVIQEGQVSWIHCGDSRLYWVRSGVLQARTRDHSYAEMDRNGALKLAHKILNRNVLYTCLGAETAPVVDLAGPHTLQQDDRLLLCSDGLWDVLQEHVLLQRLSNSPVQNAVPALVDAALQVAGSKSDNVTALAVQWEQDEAEPAAIDTQDSDGAFASTIQSLQDLEGFDVSLDEAEIERSIAEINAAIRRSAGHKKV